MTEIRREALSLPVSRLGAANPLPAFRWQQPTPFKPAPPAGNLSAGEIEGAFLWGAASILPYRVQDDYDRAQVPGMLDAIVIDNGRLRAVVLPQQGGRLFSLVDLATGRDLLFRNPVFQPANLAALNAWFSGGIEWNGLIPGHSPFTCAPVFCGVVVTARGPILRLYEFDRIREAAWQIDLFLPEGEDRLWVHGRIVNPNPRDVRLYWWTNVAVPYDPGMRVLSPADYGIEHVLPDNHLERFPFPDAHGFDGSRPGLWADATSVFFRKPDADRLWLAALGPDGYGLMQAATPEMQGRKMFFFGTNAGGRHWMEFLSRPGQGEYVEIQSGIAPTQNQEFILGPGASLEWTECYAPAMADAARIHAPDFAAACDAARVVLDQRVPAGDLDACDRWLRQQATRPVNMRLQVGSGWGALHEALTARPVAEGLDFKAGAQAPWDELARTGRFSDAALRQLPETWVTSDLWRDALLRSSEAQGETWLHALALGVIALDRDERDAARAFFIRSLALRETALALRHLALLAEDDEAERLYLHAWATGEAPPQLAIEIVQRLQRGGRLKALAAFLETLPAEVQAHERIRLARAQVALEAGDLRLAEDLLDYHFATIREGELLLGELWERLQLAKAGHRLGRTLTPAEADAALTEAPIPYHLDFRMRGED